MTLVLSPEEIADLTARVRVTAQARQLAHMQIPFVPRSDGSLVVLRSAVEAVTAAAVAKPTEPRLRFDA